MDIKSGLKNITYNIKFLKFLANILKFLFINNFKLLSSWQNFGGSVEF